MNRQKKEEMKRAEQQQQGSHSSGQQQGGQLPRQSQKPHQNQPQGGQKQQG